MAFVLIILLEPKDGPPASLFAKSCQLDPSHPITEALSFAIRRVAYPEIVSLPLGSIVRVLLPVFVKIIMEPSPAVALANNVIVTVSTAFTSLAPLKKTFNVEDLKTMKALGLIVKWKAGSI